MGLLKTVVFHLSKYLGLFAIMERLSRSQLRILCYHGAAIKNEHRFRPILFMSESRFEERLLFLQRNGYSVIPLGQAIRQWETGSLPGKCVVITIDDGWFGTYTKMLPLLDRFKFPSTLYVSSYYMEKQTQVFNVAIDYVAWSATKTKLDLSDLAASLSGVYDLNNNNERQEAISRVIEFGEKMASAEHRQDVFLRFCKALGIDGNEIAVARLLSFMTRNEVADAAHRGVDIQLHTHRHRFPDYDYSSAVSEIEQNREFLKDISGGRLTHFCYPSGEYSTDQFSWLEKLGIDSAVTTEIGLNARSQSKYELRRILDSEDMTELEFEAELSGAAHFVRKWSRRADKRR